VCCEIYVCCAWFSGMALVADSLITNEVTNEVTTEVTTEARNEGLRGNGFFAEA